MVNNYARYDAKKNLLPTDMLLYKWRFQDGGELAGNAMVAGVTDYRGGDVYPGSFIEALGTKPSYVRLDEIRLGYSTSGSKSAPVDLRFVVADVTGDDESDLYIESPITETAGMTYDVRTSVGLCKQGAGTLELSATNSSCTTGVFKVEAGTVRFPAKSGGSFGALQVTGDTVIEVAASARVSFDNSSEIAWTADKKLIFTGDMTGKSVRIGTDANALTEDQLKQVVYRKASGKEVSMSLNAEGYLQPPAKSLTIIIQ